MKQINILASLVLPMAVLFTFALTGVKEAKAFTVVTLETAEDEKPNNTKEEAFYKIGYKKLNRVETLEKFFAKYNSPLIENAETFVAVADEYNIDYRLLPAISCMESGCGKHLIPNSYNPFGWGVWGNNYIAFENYDHAIQVVGEGLNKGYFSKGLDTIDEIAPVYTPPNSYNWAWGVRFFTNEISQFETQTSQYASIT